MATVLAVIVPMNEAIPLESISIPKNPEEALQALATKLQNPDPPIADIIQKLLVRSKANGSPGLYAYGVIFEGDKQETTRNVRATRLAMACGLFSTKLFGNVILVRSSLSSREDLKVEEVYGACCISPDLRSAVQREMHRGQDTDPPTVPIWLGDALQQNYHDMSVLTQLANVMSADAEQDDSDSDSSDESENDAANASSPGDNPPPTAEDNNGSEDKKTFVTKQPLCLHCRRPSSISCPNCMACYFCDSPRDCRAKGWTHDCLCPTWRVYAERREKLSSFDWLGQWTKELTKPAFQSSEQPYEDFLKKRLGTDSELNLQSSWWSTELYGWAGGTSESAKTVDVSIRKTFSEGFAPLTDIPPQRVVEEQDIQRANAQLINPIARNAVGLLTLTSWEQYYVLRGIPETSPIALLSTFPLTLYYAIAQYGEVPCTVAQMLNRPLRIHIVGVEKEANFLDLFQEVGYLLPSDLSVELTFIVRDDMLPPKCRVEGNAKSIIDRLQLCSNLSITVASGTYGESLDPNFDCGTPDMVVALNAGLYAYESWRSVVNYLHHSPSVVGVFSDYNEYSGVNCASLAGHLGRETLCMNPFRQPRAMPVYSMNLPQFSNGFLYVMNPQELE